MRKKLTLYPDTFLWVKGNQGLLYNAKTFASAEFNVCPSVKLLCDRLTDLDNLYTIDIDDVLTDQNATDFIGMIEANGFGVVSGTGRPVVSLPPVLNLQHDINRIVRDPYRDIGENVLKYLSTLTLYVGGECRAKDYYRQILYPVCSDETLSASVIAAYLQKIDSPYLRNINLVISDARDPELLRMNALLLPYREQITFYFLYAGSGDHKEIVPMLTGSGYKVRLICEYTGNPSGKEEIEQAFEDDCTPGIRYGYDFLVRSLPEYRFWNSCIGKNGIENYNIIPVADNNPEFFREHVFLNKEDLKENALSRREIFAHQTLNTNHFGTLYVMPGGEVFSDLHAVPLGTTEDSIYDIIIRELKQNHSWRHIRNAEKCQSCLYQWICPSPTAYEKVMKTGCICMDC